MAYYGVVKSFNPAKGWGFIECEATQSLYGKDIFVLKSSIPGSFAAMGDEVSFTVVEGKSGPEASDVQFVNGGPSEPPPDSIGKGASKGGMGRASGYGKGGQFGDQGDGVQHYGTIKSFNAVKAWGFVTSPEILSLYGKDVFFLRNSVVGGFVEEGAQVSFNVIEGAKGPEATNIYPMTGTPAVPVHSPYGRQAGGRGGGKKHYGMIKSFNAEKAWGFVTGPEILDLYGKDLFFLRTSVLGGPVKAGTEVSFTVIEGAKGPEASSIEPMTGTLAVFSGHRRQQGGKGGGEQHYGTIKSFNVEKAWGFVTSPEIVSLYGKDLFFLRTSVVAGGFVEEGAQVAFTVIEGAKGPEASSIEPMGGTPAAYSGFPRLKGARGLIAGKSDTGMGGMGMAAHRGGYGKGGCPPGPPAHLSMPAPMPTGSSSQLFFGTVRSFAEEKGYGFIQCEAAKQAFGKDVFLLKSALGEVDPASVTPGCLVSFTVGMAAKGPQAQEISFLPEGSFGTNGQQGNLLSGAIKTFNAEKGWGFVTSEEIQQIFGKDIFIHKKELGDVVPSEGDVVQFSVEIGQKGNLQAQNVSMDGYEPIHRAPGGGRRSKPY